MIRRVLVATAMFGALPAAAETPAPGVARAVEALGANWRPIAPTQLNSASAVEAACRGAAQEIAAVEAATPPVITADSLSRVRAISGFVIVPSEQGDAAFFFPNRDMAWFASGLGVVSVISEAQGQLAVRDAEGHVIAMQIGRVGQRPVLRVTPPTGVLLTFVGCAPVG